MMRNAERYPDLIILFAKTRLLEVATLGGARAPFRTFPLLRGQRFLHRQHQ
jgi:hypothetical protein